MRKVESVQVWRMSESNGNVTYFAYAFAEGFRSIIKDSSLAYNLGSSQNLVRALDMAISFADFMGFPEEAVQEILSEAGKFEGGSEAVAEWEDLFGDLREVRLWKK